MRLQPYFGNVFTSSRSSAVASARTSPNHRARVSEKMQVDNDVELVRLLLTADQNA